MITIALEIAGKKNSSTVLNRATGHTLNGSESVELEILADTGEGEG